MKPKTMKMLGLLLIVIGILICIPVTIDKNEKFVAYAVDGTPFTEFVQNQNDYSGYIIPVVLAIIGFILFLVGYMTSYTQKGTEENKAK